VGVFYYLLLMNELKQIFFTIFNTQVEDADFYKHNDSTWLIFTNKKKWVFELTKEGILWYNYYFFNNFFELLSLNMRENQNYITQWVEDTIQNGVKETFLVEGTRIGIVENTIQSGVKETKMEEHHRLREVVQTVKNGVKETNPHFLEILNPINFEPVLKEMKRMNEVNIVLENGIKETKTCELHSAMSAEHIIRDGIKETWGYTQQPQIRVNEVINGGGIKETNWRKVDNHPTYLDKILKSNN